MRELILTGYKDFWPQDEESALFFGPWCFSHNPKRKFWEQNRFKLAPSPWQNPTDILEASLYIDSLSDRIIPRLTEIMNEFFNVTHNEAYWRACTILWLTHCLGMLYDRYKRLENVGCLQNRFMVKILKNHDAASNDFWDFAKKINESHYYNLSLMSEIIKSGQFDFLGYEEIDCTQGAYSLEILGENSGKVKNRVVDFLKSSAKSVFNYTDELNLKNSSVHLGLIYGMSVFDRFRIQFACKPGLFLKKIEEKGGRVIKGNREGITKFNLEFGACNKFEEIIEGLLLKYLPDSLLVSYETKKNITPKINIWIGNDIYTSAKKASQIGSILENGGRWISVQHGGGYGQLLSLPNGKVEYATGGEFITWGWKHDNVYTSSKYYALPSPMLSKLKQHKEKEHTLIFVGTISPAYMYRLATFLTPEQLTDYFSNKLKFLKTLETSIMKSIKYRPYFEDYGTNEKEFLSRILNQDQFLIGGRLTTKFSQARLVVIDHLNTSFLESLVINVPTILFCNKSHYNFSEYATPFFNRLRDVGILHDDPYSAAKKVNKVWVDPKSWWEGDQLQAVRKEFCCQFAHSSKSWRKEWLGFLKSIQDRQ
ncbi:hypothetical protein EPN54_05310 [bacterium]|nr:MAG: hypothetical protein EPN54_05310 [bacterium]